MRNRRWSKVTIELYLEEVSLDKGVYRNTLVAWGLKTLGCDGKGHLTLLEIEVYWSKDSDDCFYWVSGVKGAVGGRDVFIEVALWNTIFGNNGCGNVWCNFHNNFTVGKHVGLWQVVLEEEHNLKRSCHAYRQFDWSLHGVKLHLSNVSSCLIN